MTSERVQVLDHGYVEFVESWGADESVISAARMSTGKGFKLWGPYCGGCLSTDFSQPCPHCGDGVHTAPMAGDEKLLKYLYAHKHMTPFEMAGMTIEVQAPIFVFREWHRHRVPFGYNEMSARYTPLPDVNYVPTVERLMMGVDVGSNKQAQGTGKTLDSATAFDIHEWLPTLYTKLQMEYEMLLNAGVPKELARIILPVGRYSRMRATGNLRGWLSFMTLRCAPNAQYEIRAYAWEVARLIEKHFPRTYQLWSEGTNYAHD